METSIIVIISALAAFLLMVIIGFFVQSVGSNRDAQAIMITGSQQSGAFDASKLYEPSYEFDASIAGAMFGNADSIWA